jgi:hypothetical protein
VDIIEDDDGQNHIKFILPQSTLQLSGGSLKHAFSPNIYVDANNPDIMYFFKPGAGGSSIGTLVL